MIISDSQALAHVIVKCTEALYKSILAAEIIKKAEAHTVVDLAHDTEGRIKEILESCVIEEFKKVNIRVGEDI